MARKVATDQEIAKAVAEAFSFAEVQRILGYSNNPYSQTNLANRIRKLGLDTSHFAQRVVRGVGSKPASDITSVLVRNVSSTKRRVPRGQLIAALYAIGREYVCSECSLSRTWNGKPIQLDIDHIDGDSGNNEPSNLRFLCPNCHSQCSTSNRSVSATPYDAEQSVQYFCQGCGKIRGRTVSPLCRSCSAKNRTVKMGTIFERTGRNSTHVPKIEWPSIESILTDLETMSYLSLAEKLGVSDNSIRAHLRRAGVVPPRRKRV
jgi:5-methylcytosine-specific restriction endonuclease McrA